MGIVNLGSSHLTQVGVSHPWKITVKQRPRCYKENPGDPVTIETSPSRSGKVSARLNKPDLRASLPPQQEHSDWSQSRSNMLIPLKHAYSTPYGSPSRATCQLKHGREQYDESFITRFDCPTSQSLFCSLMSSVMIYQRHVLHARILHD